MLRKLTIENFYSFKDKQVINFAIPKGISGEKNIFCFSQGEPKVKLPKVIALFGANASG
ncbi:MAG: abortive infection protein, partial [Proteobacteria bacterium]|nr:abortive infection protein [Pseudomonadota bacterium]